MLLCLTANHRNASFDLLDRLSVGAPVAAGTLVETGDIVAGAVVLATCNRFEAYLDVDEPVTAASAVAVEQTVQVMSEASGVDPDALRDSLTVITGDGVAEHLFAVSSGLESVIVGEDEISGQVRRALERARVAGTTSSALERLFQKAAQTSRGVKNRTALGGAGRSLVRLALELAASRIADWSATRVLVVGTGQYAATTLVALRDRGVTDISVFSPSGRGAAFALKHSLTVASSPAIDVDLIITCTSNEQPVITPALVLPGHRLVIDLGLPRNVDPAVALIDGVELLDLETISIHAPLEELNATEDARALVRAAATEFATASAEDEVTPALVALRSHIFSVLDAEVARLHGPDAPRIEAALRHLTGVLLHTPSVRARELARSGDAAGFAEAVTALFGVAVEPADAAVASDEDERLA